MYKTDCVNTEQLLRLIQSIPSKKVEPLKQRMPLCKAEKLQVMQGRISSADLVEVFFLL